MQLMKNTSSLFPFEIGRCQAVSSAQNWQKPVVPRYKHLLSGEVWPEVVFMEELQPKSHTSDMETRPSDSTKHENIETGVQKHGSRCSGLMSQNQKYLAVEEGSLFAEGLESGTIMSRGVKSTEMLYSSKSTITLMKFYLSTSKITHLKIYSSKSKKQFI